MENIWHKEWLEYMENGKILKHHKYISIIKGNIISFKKMEWMTVCMIENILHLNSLHFYKETMCCDKKEYIYIYIVYNLLRFFN